MEIEQREVFEEQINKYRKLRPLYKQFSKILKQVIKNLIRGISSEFIIQDRVKTISSFANKLFSPDNNYSNPLSEINDLCGIRIILPNINEMNAVCELLRTNLLYAVIGSDDTFDTASLGHLQTYIVQLVPGLKLYERLDLEIPDQIFNLKAEVQIRTYLSHGWAANQHKIFNKYEFKVPKPYKQEMSRVKSLVSIEDDALNNITMKMQDYESIYGAYMSNEKIRAEIERLDMVYNSDKENFDIGYRIAKLAMAINDMDKSIQILSEIINSEMFKKVSELELSSVLRDLGISYHIKHKSQPTSDSFIKGQDYLKEAVQINPFDYNAWSSLGGTYKNQDNYNKALDCYKQALKVNPGDPYPLGNYLVLIIQQTGDPSHVERNHDMILKAIEKRSRQIEVMVDMPWAFFDIGLFKLFLGNVSEALDYYLKGIRYSPDIWMIETTLNTLNKLRIIEDKLKAFNIVRQILLLGILFHPNIKEKTDKVISESTVKLDAEIELKETKFDESIVIIAGGTDERVERIIDNFRINLLDAFQGFKGTIIGGGTKAGISGIIGEIQERYPNSIRTIGYVPSHIPTHVELDKRYSAIQLTGGKDFSVIEPIHYWYDLMKSGVEPNKVKLIGINGGAISAFEFHSAIVFGAQVGILDNSGRAASDLINDPNWEDTTGLVSGQKPKKLFKVLKNSSEDIYNFLTKPFVIDPDIENIQKVLIQHRESGGNLYEKNFASEAVDNTIFSGFLTALDHIANEALNVGEILSIKFRDGHLTGGFFTNREFKVVFLLNETPSVTLEEKIINFIKDVEDDLGEFLHDLHEGCRSYLGGKEMNDIMAKNFGTEILKLFDTKLETATLKKGVEYEELVQ
ncbi:MAG: tetratricopeptide repeat protein [Candidatus Lokiarchaeota archaeon]|nr:tetratricopeptide repeat protein [Candidatus Lokiarchaeota archaeon]